MPACRSTNCLDDPVAQAVRTGGTPHPHIPLPLALYPDGRINSSGFDASDETAIAAMAAALAPYGRHAWDQAIEGAATLAVVNPADRGDVVGRIGIASHDDIDAAVARAIGASGDWRALAPGRRAALLDACADALDAHRVELIALAVREAGKTFGNAIGEVRESIDFCRYYAKQIEGGAASDGVADVDRARGPLVCISPWNFPLAIFAGQVVAALASGHCVVAKAAEQTPLIAARAVALFHAAGIPRDVLQLIVGDGESVGAPLVAHPDIAGVLFTGSTDVARSIATTLARRDDDPVLIAETGGQNAMIVTRAR